MSALPLIFRVLRSARPVLRLGNTYLVTRHDDVRMVLAEDRSFGVPYREKLDRIMGQEPFILGMPDDCRYRRDLAALRSVMPFADAKRLGVRVEAIATEIVAASPGRLDVVELVRQISFEFLAEYLGIPSPDEGDLPTWGTRLFEYQFVAEDKALVDEVDLIAPALRRHVQQAIEQRRQQGEHRDDVLGRCLAMQAQGVDGFDDNAIRTALVGMIVGGPPQPPMVVPQAMEQLLRRPDALASAQAAARSGDDRALAAHIAEAMRFDPLAPWLPRIAISPRTIKGGRHAVQVPAGAKILASIASAMRDERRVPDPHIFDATRTSDQYLHFGWGMHQCFGLEINQATLHLMVKPLLQRAGLRRAKGPSGRLAKRGAFASSLIVEFERA